MRRRGAAIIDDSGPFLEEERMAQVLVRNLDEQVVERLKAEAEKRGVSLEGHLREILTDRVRPTMREIRERFQNIQESYGDQTLSDSAELIHEERYG
jgi:antitoxin FitA